VIKITGHIVRILSRFKYHIVVVMGVLYVGFLGDDCFMKRFEYDYRISDLQDEIAKYEKVFQTNNQRLHELRADSSAMARVGRERYFMKTDDEDVFVLSDDDNSDNNPAFYETIK